MDADILINSPVQPFLESLEYTEDVGLFKDQGKAAKEGRIYHSGIMHLNRHKSQPFLERWRNEITEKQPRWDQEALVNIASNYSFHFFNPKWLLFPSQNNSTPEHIFLHFTHPRRQFIPLFAEQLSIKTRGLTFRRR
tara:strand:- start:82 stop:492 length:411 start_codon:yes stop_codon:yes gene_type:complete